LKRDNLKFYDDTNKLRCYQCKFTTDSYLDVICLFEQATSLILVSF